MNTEELTQYAYLALPILSFVVGSYITYLAMRKSKKAKVIDPKWLRETRVAINDNSTEKVTITNMPNGYKKVKVKKKYY